MAVWKGRLIYLTVGISVFLVFACLSPFAGAMDTKEPTQNVQVLPINPGLCEVEIKPREITATTIPADKETILKQLPNSDMFVYVFDAQLAGKLGLAFLSAEASRRSSVIVQEYVMYRDAFDPETNRITRFGIGVRIVVAVSEKSAKAATLSIPAIAAQVEANKLRATIRLQVLGISGKNITEAVPLPAELTFTTLLQIYQVMDVIKKAVWDEETTITPQIIGVSGDWRPGER